MTKIYYAKDNLKQKVIYQTETSKAETYHTNGKHLLYSWLGTCIS